ncbi:MAG: C_GCAxxG_C_C family protein [Sedimentisphaerales bacterium]|nr:C_GCAxxG_C_C family protein [Sedimentisphaerales bacterium]
MSETTDRAVALFEKGYNCSQAVLAVFAEQFGMDFDTALKVASGLGGGIGRMGQTCGALTGAYMVLGLACGTENASDKLTKETVYDLIVRMAERFAQRNGTTECKDLLGFAMRSPTGQIAAKEPGAFDKCPGYVRDAAEIVEEILKKEKNQA